MTDEKKHLTVIEKDTTKRGKTKGKKMRDAEKEKKK